MLTPAQVIPFLTHADSFVRDHARLYFISCSNPAPLTADDVWAALDKFPTGDDAMLYLEGLSSVPQTEASVLRALDALATDPGNYAPQLRYAIQNADLPIVLRLQESILACPGLTAQDVAAVRFRLRCVETPTDALWQRLTDLQPLLADGEELTLRDEADAIVDALSRRGAEGCEPALSLLNTGDLKAPLMADAVRILGAARYEPALDDLVKLLGVSQKDVGETAVRALANFGTADAVRRVTGGCPTTSEDGRADIATILSATKVPESEQFLASLLEREHVPWLRRQLVESLCGLGSLAGLEAGRNLIAEDPENPGDDDATQLRETLLATAIMQGVTLPEEAQWRQSIETASAGRLSLDDLYAQTRELLAKIKDRPAEPTRPAWEAIDDELDALGDATPPLQRAAAKVGRNDPCPCGSGKKYKKCCLNA